MLRTLGVKKILYGGSVNTANIVEICNATDGVLIGGASLDSNNFADMICHVAQGLA